jgi:hypothetical protein
MKRVIPDYVLPIGATPALQAILNYIGLFKLKPLEHWGMPPDSLPLIAYLVAAGSAAVACFCNAKKGKAKAALIIIPVLLLVISWRVYVWVSNTPPPIDMVKAFDWTGGISFFMTYVCYGFVVARIVKAFA